MYVHACSLWYNADKVALSIWINGLVERERGEKCELESFLNEFTVRDDWFCGKAFVKYTSVHGLLKHPLVFINPMTRLTKIDQLNSNWTGNATYSYNKFVCLQNGRWTTDFHLQAVSVRVIQFCYSNNNPIINKVYQKKCLKISDIIPD